MPVIDFPASGPQPVQTTHEQFVHAVRRVVAARVSDTAARERLLAAKLVYGAGPVGVRGLCYFGAWAAAGSHDFIEIAAVSEESWVQLAGTTIHELGHCLAGSKHGHDAAWKAACQVLGLREVSAAGQSYAPEQFDAAVWAAIESLPRPSDGTPAFLTGAGAPPAVNKPCPLGIGTRGGRSRGPGSGSRMRLYVCGCPEGTGGRKVRTACDDLDANCNRCGTKFERSAPRV